LETGETLTTPGSLRFSQAPQDEANRRQGQGADQQTA